MTDSMEAIRKLAGQGKRGRVLAIVSSHDNLGETGYPTGYWISELAHPYLLLDQAGYEVDVAGPKGGKAPVDPCSNPNIPPDQCRSAS